MLGLIYDVHGNLPALEAVLADVDAAGVDLIVVGGDLVAGPMPDETLERLLALGERVRFVRGNADRAVASGAGEHGETWIASQLSGARRRFLSTLSLVVVVEVNGLGPVLFCHATPRSDEEIITRATPDERLRRILGDVAQEVVVCGHTHVQFDRSVDGTRVVNAGSVGRPYEREPGAYWALLGPDVELRRAEYDLEAAAARIRATGWPDADEFVRENVLTVPSRAEALAVFEPRVG